MCSIPEVKRSAQVGGPTVERGQPRRGGAVKILTSICLVGRLGKTGRHMINVQYGNASPPMVCAPERDPGTITMATVLNDNARKALTSGRDAHLVTLNPDGSPQTPLVWVGLDNDEIVCAPLLRNWAR